MFTNMPRENITPELLANIHPGNILKEDYLPNINMTEYRLAQRLSMRQAHLSEFLNGKRGLTANWALRLGKLFGQTPQFWLTLQNEYDLLKAQMEYGDVVDGIVPLESDQEEREYLKAA